MKTQLSLILLALSLTTISCGKDDKEDRKENEGEEKNSDDPQTGSEDDSLLVDDEEAAGQAVTAQIDDAVSAAVEDNDTPAGASLAALDGEGEVTRFRECKEEAGKAIVDIRRSAKREFSWEGPVRKAESNFSAYYEKTRTWAKEGGEVKCSEDKKHAEIPVADMQGVTLDVTFKHERSRKVTIENLKKGTKSERSFSYNVEGDRHLVWKSVTEAGDVLTIEKEATGTANRKLEIQKKDGTTKTLEATVTNAEGQPLVISVERNKDTLVWISRTIKSGTRIATGKDGGRVEVSFTDVKYTKEKRCTAVSGSISGKIFKKDATEPSVTFEVTFDGDSKTVNFSNGKEFEYSPEGCDLDEAEQATEAASAAEVTPAAE